MGRPDVGLGAIVSLAYHRADGSAAIRGQNGFPDKDVDARCNFASRTIQLHCGDKRRKAPVKPRAMRQQHVPSRHALRMVLPGGRDMADRSVD